MSKKGVIALLTLIIISFSTSLAFSLESKPKTNNSNPDIRAGVSIILADTVNYPAHKTKRPIDDLKPVGLPQPIPEPKLTYLGEFSITGYCACIKCCGKTDGITATGVKATANHTIAVDPKLISYGSILVIDGIEYRAEDCGGAIKGNKLDIYFDTHDEARQYAKQLKKVYLKEE